MNSHEVLAQRFLEANFDALWATVEEVRLHLSGESHEECLPETQWPEDLPPSHLERLSDLFGRMPSALQA